MDAVKAVVLFCVSAILVSCSGNYSKVGEEFLDKGFNSFWYEAEEYLSDELSDEDKQDLKLYVAELKSEYGVTSYEFSYRAGYEFDVIWSTLATGYYSFNDDTEHILYVDFEKKDGKWVIEDIGESSTEDIIQEYSVSQKDYTEAIESNDKNKIKTAKTELKENEKVVNAFRDFFNDEEWTSFINSK